MATNVTDLLGVRMDELMRVTIERGASDLHMCVGLPPMLRIDGRLTGVLPDRIARFGVGIIKRHQIIP